MKAPILEMQSVLQTKLHEAYEAGVKSDFMEDETAKEVFNEGYKAALHDVRECVPAPSNPHSDAADRVCANLLAAITRLEEEHKEV